MGTGMGILVSYIPISMMIDVAHVPDPEYAEAGVMLNDALAQFQDIGDRLGAAQCSQSLDDILYMQTKYDEAAAIFNGVGFFLLSPSLSSPASASCSVALPVQPPQCQGPQGP